MTRTRAFVTLGLMLAAGLTPLAQGSRPASTSTQTRRPFVPVTDEMLWQPSPSNWLSSRRPLDSQGCRPLDPSERTTVSKLRMVWARGMGAGNMEATPLVYDGVMYTPSPGDFIQAVDAKTGDLLWEYRRKLPEGAQGTNRTMAIWGTTL